MASHSEQHDGHELMVGIYSYLTELKDMRDACMRHQDSAAIHEKGEALQIYRLFDRAFGTAQYLLRATERLPSWEQSCFWHSDAEQLSKLQRDVAARMNKHKKQHPIVTRGVAWEGYPILIHAYKFEPDPIMKVELVLPDVEEELPQLPLKKVASALKCHEYLIPKSVAEAKPPYERHETEFSTLWDFVRRSTPPSLYAAYCFPSQGGQAP